MCVYVHVNVCVCVCVCVFVCVCALKNSNCCFSKYFWLLQLHDCPSHMLIQRMQWTSGCKYLQWEASEVYISLN